jgi:hypothetical protein
MLVNDNSQDFVTWLFRGAPEKNYKTKAGATHA